MRVSGSSTDHVPAFACSKDASQTCLQTSEVDRNKTHAGDEIHATSDKTFDENASNYYDELEQGLRLSGESADYFARVRVDVTKRIVTSLTNDEAVMGPPSRTDGAVNSWDRILDYGCGIGTAARFLATAFPGIEILGSDIADSAIRRAAATHPDPPFRWTVGMSSIESQSVDLAYCNGVFHHIQPELRNGCVADVFETLRSGGLFFLWENNPWNPGTQIVMRRIPFDRDAICLPITETRDRLELAGFKVIRAETYFYFPRSFSAFRPIERLLHFIPFGAQYVVVGQKA
jgi:SAM-dependent methyltransferase